MTHETLPSREGYHRLPSGASIEVFWSGTKGNLLGSEEVGWYWWACHPGCLPDGEPIGPFRTSMAAYTDAQGQGHEDVAL